MLQYEKSNHEFGVALCLALPICCESNRLSGILMCPRIVPLQSQCYICELRILFLLEGNKTGLSCMLPFHTDFK